MNLRKQRYLIISSFVGFFLLLIFLVVLPLLKDIQTASKELRRQQKELMRIKAEIEGLKTFKENYQNREGIQRIKKFFVNPVLPLDFIRFLEKKAEKEGISLEISTFPQKITEENEAVMLQFLLKGRGEFPNFYNFLGALEKAPYLIEIETLNIILPEKNKKQELVEENIIEVSLLLKVPTMTL